MTAALVASHTLCNIPGGAAGRPLRRPAHDRDRTAHRRTRERRHADHSVGRARDRDAGSDGNRHGARLRRLDRLRAHARRLLDARRGHRRRRVDRRGRARARRRSLARAGARLAGTVHLGPGRRARRAPRAARGVAAGARRDRPRGAWRLGAPARESLARRAALPACGHAHGLDGAQRRRRPLGRHAARALRGVRPAGGRGRGLADAPARAGEPAGRGGAGALATGYHARRDRREPAARRRRHGGAGHGAAARARGARGRRRRRGLGSPVRPCDAGGRDGPARCARDRRRADELACEPVCVRGDATGRAELLAPRGRPARIRDHGLPVGARPPRPAAAAPARRCRPRVHSQPR